MLFADISFNLPFNSLFTYLVPTEIEEQIEIGKKVIVSFLKDKKKMGIVLKLHTEEPLFKVKNILHVINDFFILPHYAQKIAIFISNYYAAPFNEALHLFVPEGVLKEKESVLTSEDGNYWEHWKTNTDSLVLNEEQEQVYKTILNDTENMQKHITGLIFGITGSGKTEIYEKLLETTIKNKKQGLLLLPEIALTAQTIQRFKGFFGKDSIAVIHSKLSKKERLLMFKSIAKGHVSVILGPRSALFSPFKNLGLILIDEEQDFSYKSHRSPRYHTRHVAYQLALTLNIPFIMGSATPSLETFYAAQIEKIKLYRLKKRYHNVSLPKVTVIDMAQEFSFFSDSLMRKIVETKNEGNQSILFINRRGFSPTIVCKSCQFLIRCPHCSITLTYHKNKGDLLCHYCGYKEPYIKKCPQCQNSTLEPRGGGTERIEEEIQELFHSFRLLRMDRDSTQKKEAHEKIISEFRERKADILIGTQMVVKGLDFPFVSLVGVLTCDSVLNLPDFRSAEYTFSLLTQVAGRSGRTKEGEVIIQTRYKDHYAIQKAIHHDYEGFYHIEIEKRKEHHYPPFSKILRFVIRSENEIKAQEMATKIATNLKNVFPHLKLIGPSSCVIEKIAGQYRYQFLTKVQNPLSYGEEIRKILKEYNHKSNFHVEYDVDPVSLL